MTVQACNDNLTWLRPIAHQFVHPGQTAQIQPLGNGNINDTYLVSLEAPNQTQFVLQRINTQVFQHPDRVMQNMRTLTEHIHTRLQHNPLDRRWEVPRVILTQTGQDHWVAPEGGFWRAISFIAGSQSWETLQDQDHAREVGYALGLFHGLLSDLAPDRLADTLPGFHITPNYLRHYQAVHATVSQPASAEVAYCCQFVADRASWVPVLEVAKAQGKLPLRLMHGDPKVNNIMFDTTTGQAVSVVDLDTVKPGLVHYDVGDCLRSGCNPAGEETPQWEAVSFEVDLCHAILQGYLSVAKAFLTEADYDYLFDAIRLIAFELGLRFLSDHLAGNVYFKVKHPDHNLLRALVQFQLTASIEQQETTIRQMIQDLR
jgi:Ser/Thr protein kinase RdoA (MazF antagonist)